MTLDGDFHCSAPGFRQDIARQEGTGHPGRDRTREGGDVVTEKLRHALAVPSPVTRPDVPFLLQVDKQGPVVRLTGQPCQDTQPACTPHETDIFGVSAAKLRHILRRTGAGGREICTPWRARGLPVCHDDKPQVRRKQGDKSLHRFLAQVWEWHSSYLWKFMTGVEFIIHDCTYDAPETTIHVHRERKTDMKVALMCLFGQTCLDDPLPDINDVDCIKALSRFPELKERFVKAPVQQVEVAVTPGVSPDMGQRPEPSVSPTPSPFMNNFP